MTHKEAPPETDVQAACRTWWTTRMGATAVGWGREKAGGFLAAFARDAQAAWQAAREQATTEARSEHATERSSYHYAWTTVLETMLEVAGDEMQAQAGTNLERALGAIRIMAARAPSDDSAEAQALRRLCDLGQDMHQAKVAGVDDMVEATGVLCRAYARRGASAGLAAVAIREKAGERTRQVNALRQAAQAVADALGMDGQLPTHQEVDALNAALANFTGATA